MYRGFCRVFNYHCHWAMFWINLKISHLKVPPSVHIKCRQSPRNVEYFSYLSIMTKCMMRDLHLNLNPGLPWKMQSKKKALFTNKFDLNVSKNLQSVTFGAQLGIVLKLGHFDKWFRNTCDFFVLSLLLSSLHTPTVSRENRLSFLVLSL